jgi:hypothetical protein
VCLSGLVVAAQGGGRYSAVLEPDQEVPAVSSAATGTITLDIDEDNEEITYELSFSGLSSTVAQSHIHFGQPGVNGGIVLWLCEGTSASPLASTPTCPQSGTVTGTLKPADVVAIGGSNAGQQIAAGEFAEAVAFIKKGLAYANVHTANSGGGEIRGQIRQGGGHN